MAIIGRKEAIHHCAGYVLRLQKGDGGLLVVSLCGIGQPDRDLMAWEFGDSLRELGTFSVAFVQDRSRTWFNTPAGFEETLTVLRDFIAANAISRVVTLGLSMGGFGALLFGKLLAADLIVAISPQTAIDPSCVRSWDNRWEKYVGALAYFPYGDLGELPVSRSRIVAMSGDTDYRDVTHVLRLQTIPGIELFLVPGGAHNLGRWLRDEGRLIGILRHFILDVKDPEVEGYLDAYRLHDRHSSLAYAKAVGYLKEGKIELARRNSSFALACRPDLLSYRELSARIDSLGAQNAEHRS